jgi:ribosomal protein L18E
MHNFGTRLVPNPTLENNFSLWKLAQALTKWARSNESHLWMHNFGTRLVPNPTLEKNFSLWKLAQALTKWARLNQSHFGCTTLGQDWSQIQHWKTISLCEN